MDRRFLGLVVAPKAILQSLGLLVAHASRVSPQCLLCFGRFVFALCRVYESLCCLFGGGVMELREILSQYSDEAIERLARDKVDEISAIRLPRSVLEQEVRNALVSFSYVAETLAGSHPPTFAFIKLIMEAPEYKVSADGFRELVMERTDAATRWVTGGDGLPSGKDYALYRSMLLAAWREGGGIDPSEANLLEVLRTELGLTMREHLMLEHHPDVRPIWDSPKAYEHARNHLLVRGLVLTLGDQYAIADEVRLQVRRYWEMELHDREYRRLLGILTGADLRIVLESAGLQLSGSKDERIERIVAGLVPPSFSLGTLSIVALKDLSRNLGLQVSMAKNDLIQQLVDHFDQSRDLSCEEGRSGRVDEHFDEGRKSSVEHLRKLLAGLSGNHLYEILTGLGLPRSGSKEDRIERLIGCGSSEAAMLSQLRRGDLIGVCRKFGLPVSGLKEEIVQRLIESALRDCVLETDEEAVIFFALPRSDEMLEDLNDADPLEPASKAAEVPGIEYIVGEYPELSQDQHVVLALLREARSLNERDVQRLASRYDLGWTLPKAHMTELGRTLASAGRVPFRVRSTGAANIYEWVDGANANGQSFGRLAARDVIDALRQGVVPEYGLEMLMVGQESARFHLKDQMEYIASGRSAFKFIRGGYGSGKSFISAWLRDQALSSGFVTSSVRVSAEITMADLAGFYVGLMDGLRTPEKRKASSFSDILESWLLVMQRNTEKAEGLAVSRIKDRPALIDAVSERIKHELSQLAAHDPGMAPALSALYKARIKGDEDEAMAARAWLRGDRSLPLAMLRRIGVRGWLESEQVFPRLRAILEIIMSTHLRGLVILIDELELVRRRPHKQTRDQAYETLRALIDEIGENRLPGCFMICTGTDAFFDDRRYGLASYEALLHRIQAPEFGDERRSMRQPVIQLEGLDRVRLVDVAKRTRGIHAAAYSWDAAGKISDEEIDFMVAKWTSFGGDCIDRLPRPFLRQLVHVLDLCEENPLVSARDCLGEPDQDPQANEALLRPLAI